MAVELGEEEAIGIPVVTVTVGGLVVKVEAVGTAGWISRAAVEVRRSNAEVTWAIRACAVIVALLVRRAPCHSLSESGFGPTIGGDGVGIASVPPCNLAQ